MKILIAGSGKLGETLARQLCTEEHDVTLIDSDQSVLESGLNRYDVMGINGKLRIHGGAAAGGGGECRPADCRDRER